MLNVDRYRTVNKLYQNQLVFFVCLQGLGTTVTSSGKKDEE